MYEYRCNIVKVVDGDTVDVDIDLGFEIILKNQRIRLYGIDAPESRTRDKEEKKYGLLAKQRVIDFCNTDDLVLRTKEYNSKGKFGRILGDIINDDGDSLCETLLNEHHAAPYFGLSKEEIVNEHLKNREILSGNINNL